MATDALGNEHSFQFGSDEQLKAVLDLIHRYFDKD